MKKLVFTLLAALLLMPALAPAQEPDRAASFRGRSLQESVAGFRDWFGRAYERQIESYLRDHKEDYTYRARDFYDFQMTFKIDTLGRPRLVNTDPEELGDVQKEILHQTLDSAPRWEPAFQNGRKVNMAFTMMVSMNR